MTIEKAHYEFKIRLNKVDSQGHRNLLVPEIDVYLNNAIDTFINLIAEPRTKTLQGFELSQRSLDDISELVEHNKKLVVTDNIAKFPDNYRHFIKGYAIGSQGKCVDKKLKVYIERHNNDFEEDEFAKTDFFWREVNATIFTKNQVQFYAEDFKISTFVVDYIRKPAYVHYAKNYPGGSYKLNEDVTLSGKQDFELNENTHSEIVDIAVYLAARSIGLADQNAKFGALKLNNIVN